MIYVTSHLIRQEGNVEVTYLPLLLNESVGRLTLTSPQLGIYIYEFRLRSTSPGPEKPLHFKAGLGTRQIQPFRFIHYARTKTEYVCKVDHPEFTVEKSITVAGAPPGGTEVSVDVVYEPSKLGDISTTLTAMSSDGGEYTCTLYGHCAPPQPQGPINLKGGTPATVTVYNPFNKGSQFLVNVDNSVNFIVKPTEVFIPSKKSSTISISYKNSSPGITAGKITITSEDSPAPWIVYLKGTN